MKNTTRKYLWILLANALLLGFVGTLWHVRFRVPAAPVPVLRGELARLKIEPAPAPVHPATYLAGLKAQANLPPKGQGWTIVNLWASWCAPCLLELPSLQKLADASKGKGVNVVAISIDNVGNAQALEAIMMHQKTDTLSIARNWDDRGEVADALWPQKMPVTYVIDPQGRLFATMSGGINWASPDALAFVDSLRGRAQKP